MSFDGLKERRVDAETCSLICQVPPVMPGSDVVSSLSILPNENSVLLQKGNKVFHQKVFLDEVVCHTFNDFL